MVFCHFFFFSFFLKKSCHIFQSCQVASRQGLVNPFPPSSEVTESELDKTQKSNPRALGRLSLFFVFWNNKNTLPTTTKSQVPKKTLFFENCYQKFLTFSHMSLHIFKETLKPCTKNPSSSLNSTSKTQSFDPIIPRKPPKSSLSRQLLRLQDPEYLPQLQKPHCLPNQQPQRHSDEEEKEEAEEPDGFGRPTKLGQFQFEHTGPFEPLVLSSQGEVPVVQVILCLRSFCL